MRTPSAAALLACVLVAAPALARPAAKKPAAPGAGPADPLKWDPEKERNQPDQWWALSLEGSDEKYVAYDVPKEQRKGSNAYAPSAEGNATKGKPGGPRPFPYALPLLKVVKGGTSCAKQGDKNVCQVTLEASNYKLELGAGPFRVTCVQKQDGCPPAIIDAPIKMSGDAAALQGVDLNDASLALRMLPPGTAAAKAAPTTTAATQDDPALGPWEQLAWNNIAKLEGASDASAKTNKEKRAKLGDAVAKYAAEFGEKGQKAGQPMQTLEIGFIQGRLGDGAKDYDLVAGSSEKNPEKDAFTKRWRAFILADIAKYTEVKGNDNPQGFTGSTEALNAVRRAQLDAPDAPKSELEQKLEALHPSKTRRDAAQRAVVAAYLQNNKDSKKDAKAAYDALMAGKPVDFAHIYNDLAKGWIARQVKNDKEVTLAGVPKETLLDAYCDPNGFGGGAGNGAQTGAMKQLKATSAASTQGAGTTGTEGASATAGGTINGNAGASAGDPLAAECSARLKDMRSKFVDQPVGPIGALRPGAGGGGTDGPEKFVARKSKIGENIGDNAGPEAATGDPKNGDHVKMGVGMGLYFGLLGAIGGPMGLLVGGLLGFALGFGVDKLTNKADS